MSTTKLSLPSRIMGLQYKFYDRLRHRGALKVARERGTVHDFSGFRGARQCLLVTFKRSGEPVPTPVNFGLGTDGKLYLRCEPQLAKIKRLRHNPHVRLCPCSFRGRPRGALVEATARILPGSESKRAHAIIAANWDPASRLMERSLDRIGVPVIYVEVTPAG